MKKLLILFSVISLASCKTIQKMQQAAGTKKIMKGNWILNDINYSKTGDYNVQLLGDVSKTCFEGSQWNFIPNNYRGTYSIQGQDCATGVRNFIFTVQSVDAQTGRYDFLLKPTNANYKSITNQGFRLQLTSLNETHMQWQQTVSADGEPFTITMNFIKQ